MSIICLCKKKNRCPVNIHTVISGSFVRNSRWLSNKFLCAALRHISIAAPHQTGGGANGAIQARHLEGARSLVVRQAIPITAPAESRCRLMAYLIFERTASP